MPALVFGAGEAAEQLVRSLNRSPNSRYRAVALLDDDLRKARRVIDGVRVVGTREALPRVAADLDIRHLIVAVPSAQADLVKDLDQTARDAGYEPSSSRRSLNSSTVRRTRDS